MGVKPSIAAVGGLSIRDKVITTCKRCRHGIKESDERVWICEPLTVGLVHDYCATAYKQGSDHA